MFPTVFLARNHGIIDHVFYVNAMSCFLLCFFLGIME